MSDSCVYRKFLSYVELPLYWWVKAQSNIFINLLQGSFTVEAAKSSSDTVKYLQWSQQALNYVYLYILMFY